MEDAKKQFEEIIHDLHSLFEGHLKLSSDKIGCATAIASAVTHSLGIILGRTCAFSDMSENKFLEFKRDILTEVDKQSTEQYRQAILFKKALSELNDLANTIFKTKH